MPPSLPYDLVTFDCYGTLIDWERGMSAVLHALGREVGIRVDAPSMVRRYAQLELGLEQASYRRYADILQLGLSALFKERGVTLGRRQAGAFARSLSDWKPFPEVRTALRRLRSAGYRTAILSNIDDRLLARSLRRIEIPFDHVVTAEAVRSYKPAARHWQRVLTASRLPKRRVLHVGASLVYDIVPAKTLGIHCVWINRNGDKPAPGAAPRHVFPDLRPLVRLLTRSR